MRIQRHLPGMRHKALPREKTRPSACKRPGLGIGPYERLAGLASLQREILQSSIAPRPTRPLPSSSSEALPSNSKDGSGVLPGVLSIQSGVVEPAG